MTRIRLAVGAIATLVVLTACGGGAADEQTGDFADGSAADINEAFGADMSGLESVHIAGTVTSGGSELELDLALDTAGDCTGNVGIAGGNADILRVDDVTWFRPDEAFWEASTGDPAVAQTIVEAVGEKWVEVPAEQDSLGQVCDLDQILSQLTESSNNDPEKDGTDEVDGVASVKLTRVDDQDPDATVTAWIAVEGKHYLLKYEKAGGAEPGTVLLNDFDKALDLAPPAEDEVFDLSTLR